MICFSLWFGSDVLFYNRPLKKHIILFSKCTSRLADKRIHIKLVSSVDYLLKKATSQLDSGVVTHPRRSRRHPAKSLNDLDFADDIALLESSISRAQAQLTKTSEAAADLGLVISAPKTEYMTVNCNPQPAPSSLWRYN